ncbi:hypothetical protein MTO96_003206 [Rhipicephalus appendiculatus]
MPCLSFRVKELSPVPRRRTSWWSPTAASALRSAQSHSDAVKRADGRAVRPHPQPIPECRSQVQGSKQRRLYFTERVTVLVLVRGPKYRLYWRRGCVTFLRAARDILAGLVSTQGHAHASSILLRVRRTPDGFIALPARLSMPTKSARFYQCGYPNRQNSSNGAATAANSC